jgi:chemotaxis protein methyltransferase CheR
LLRSPAGAEEIRALIDRISTNHTSFFREMAHFDFLRDVVLPKTRQTRDSREPFRIWSAACSSGEEPYSLAIWMSEHFAPAPSGGWEIEASDISTRVLELAQRGVYDESRLASVGAEMRPRYFQKGLRDWKGYFRVKDDLRRQINFRHLNLLEPDYPFTKPFDVIFCRNVMIYFDRATHETLLRSLSERLVPGGYLMVGHSESLNSIKHSLRSVQPAIYWKPLA